MQVLIGNTGLIGKTLKENISFDYEFNSKNIVSFEDFVPNEIDLYLSCLPATKWMVNQDPKLDYQNINSIFNIIKTKRYRNIFLFSTIDVYSSSPNNSDETYNPNFKKFEYGSNRLLFEFMIDQFIEKENLYTFRLPALFGRHLKKNVLYDFIYKNNLDKINLNSYYQWYDLSDLFYDINKFVEDYPKEKTFNFFTEPIYTKDILNKFFPDYGVQNEFDLVEYNYKTKYFESGYMKSKSVIMEKMEKFINEIRNN